ncbi:MAG: M60 family metallopeptidase, partial [Nannocystaceae bacterium]
MLAGSPIRMQLNLVDPNHSNRISASGEPGANPWGYSHELGHDFANINAVWKYQKNTLESWPNVFSVQAHEELGLPIHSKAQACAGADPVPYDNWDAWKGLCFLLEFEVGYGWEFYAEFFTILNATQNSDIPNGDATWHWVHDRFEEIAGEDITPVFVAWDVPNPG